MSSVASSTGVVEGFGYGRRGEGVKEFALWQDANPTARKNTQIHIRFMRGGRELRDLDR